MHMNENILTRPRCRELAVLSDCNKKDSKFVQTKVICKFIIGTYVSEYTDSFVTSAGQNTVI